MTEPLDTFGNAIAAAENAAGNGVTVGPPNSVPPEPPPLGPQGSRQWWKWLLGGATVVAVVIAGIAGYLYWQAQGIVDEFQSGAKKQVVNQVLPQLDKAPATPAPGITKAINILAIGADKRAKENERGRSDTIIVVRIDPKKKTVSMLSLPRDLQVPIPGHGTDKINAAYSIGGAGLLTATVREYLGIPINHFMEVDFSGFDGVVKSLGGVYLPVDGRYYHQWGPSAADNWSAINLHPGYQKLNPADTLSFVRFRHMDDDWHRAARQQLFLREVGRQMRAEVGDIGNIPQVLSLLKAVAKSMTSDLHGLSEPFHIVNTLRGIDAERLNRVTMDGSDSMQNGIYYMVPTQAQKEAALQAWANPGRALRRHKVAKGSKRKHSKHKAKVSTENTFLATGESRSLMKAAHGLKVCVPTRLPIDYSWPTAPNSQPVRSYSLSGHPAVAAWMTAGSGDSVLWMWTTWKTAPILSKPSTVVVRNGKQYRLWFDSGRLRQVAWTVGETQAWLTNTLRNDLTNSQMLALATACR